ncbi:MAG: TIGR02594 family protein, partial [Bradyrhizobium sp.]
MLQLFAFRRSLRVLALALCSVSIAVIATPASARPHHGAGRHARAYHAGHHARHYNHHRHRHVARASRWERGVAQMQAGGFADANASLVDHNSTLTPSGGMMASAPT